jgi:4-hydroxy-tetrahydrodipicolinate reductase
VIRVGVLGAAGRMGRQVCDAIAAAEDLELAAAIDPDHAGTEVAGVEVAASPEALSTERATVAVDFTLPGSVMANARWCLSHGVHAVIGTTGITAEDLEELRGLTSTSGTNCVVAPNFALGAALLVRFAAEAARFFDAAEIIELHHDGKVDAPSGTAIATARAIGAARRGAWTAPGPADADARGSAIDGVQVHAVRLPGLVAHEEVLFGGPGQVLTIRHDAMDRAAFMPGVLLAIRGVSDRPGLTVGLDALLG